MTASDNEPNQSKKRKKDNGRREMELASSSMGNQASILGQVIQELRDIDNDTPDKLDQIVMLGKKGQVIMMLEQNSRILERY